jgi:YVTN family beta-propeller protein
VTLYDSAVVRTLTALVAALVLLLAGVAAAAPATRDVLVVGNNWEGTADVLDAHTFENLTRLNIVPDLDERLAEIQADPVASGFFLGINLLIGEGHNQYVDDAFTSHDGRFLYVSRPSLADVVAIDLGTKKIVWRVKVDGNRADHMAISPDGTKLLVSASTGNVVHEIDTASGQVTGKFDSGDSPHENNYSADGKRIYHASIGLVYTPLDQPVFDGTKGDRYFQVVDADTLQILKRVNVGEVMAANGYPGYSAAVRPMALSPDERTAYLQLSFLHGFVEWDLAQMKPLRVAQLPVSEEAQSLPREAYLLDSAHHGMTMNPAGTKLCVAGTMSDYAAIVDRASFDVKIAEEGEKPYWVTNNGDGRYCFVSFSGDDRVSVVSYASGKEIASVPVGDHPQRMRLGVIRSEYLPPVKDGEAPRISRAKVVRRRGRHWLRVRLSEQARLRIGVRRARGGARFARVLRRQARRGMNRYRLRGLRTGRRYRLVLRATDAAGNRSKRKIVRYRAR